MGRERSESTRGGNAGPATAARPTRADEQRRLARRALLLGGAVSILFHVIATLTVRFRIEFAEPPPPVVSLPPSEQYAGTRVYDVVPIEGEAAPIEVQLRVPPRATSIPAAPPGEAAPTDATVPGGARTRVDPIGDRLRPRLGHARVWTEPDATPTPPTPDQLVRARIAERLTAYNDSVAAEAAREARARDWTVEDGSGGRWGIADGKIYLGTVTIPWVNEFVTPPGRRDEIRSRIVDWQELQSQAQRELVREVVTDRVRAVRERRDAERQDSARAGAR
jgi:hypothetical protein